MSTVTTVSFKVSINNKSIDGLKKKDLNSNILFLK